MLIPTVSQDEDIAYQLGSQPEVVHGTISTWKVNLLTQLCDQENSFRIMWKSVG